MSVPWIVLQIYHRSLLERTSLLILQGSCLFCFNVILKDKHEVRFHQKIRISRVRRLYEWLKISRLHYQPTIQSKLRDLEKYRKRNKRRRKCNYNNTAKVWQLISWNANMRVNFAPTLSIPIIIRFTSFVSRISISNAMSTLQLGTKSATQNLCINNSSFLYIPIYVCILSPGEL